jgi:hypothetical protein
MIRGFIIFALPEQRLFRMAGQSHKGTAAGLPFDKFSLLHERQAAGIFKLVDKIFAGIFPHAEIIAQKTALLNNFQSDY